MKIIHFKIHERSSSGKKSGEAGLKKSFEKQSISDKGNQKKESAIPTTKYATKKQEEKNNSSKRGAQDKIKTEDSDSDSSESSIVESDKPKKVNFHQNFVIYRTTPLV